MIVVIDNYDSFSFNLVQYVGEANCPIRVFRNDQVGVEEVLSLSPSGIIISPGPGRPENAGISVALVRAAQDACPVLGVCLGHQALGYAYGAKIVGAPELVHGKASLIWHKGEGIFEGVPNPFWAGRYHSLIVAREGLPECLEVVAETHQDSLIMGIKLRGRPVWGVQFHPESILTRAGKKIIANFLSICGIQHPSLNEVLEPEEGTQA